MPRRLLVIRRKGRLKMKSRSVLQLIYSSETGKEVIREYAVRDLDAVVIIGGGLYVESSVLSVLSSMNIPVSVIAKDMIGLMMNPVVVITPYYRRLQYRLDRISELSIALEYVKAKIRGMSNILKYYGIDPPPIEDPPEEIDDPIVYEQAIRRWESVSSGKIWSRLLDLIDENILGELINKYGFNGRKPRHPDPFNKALSVMYAVLYSLATKALIASGLDPTYGFLHRTRYSTPLTFDYTEMFKPIAIQATIEMINKEGLPEIGEDGELTRESVNKAIRQLYNYLTLKHKKTRKTPYQYLFLKAYTLAKHLEGKTPQRKLTITWNKKQYAKV